MFVDREKLLVAITKLDVARTQEKNACSAPRKNQSGQASRKLNANAPRARQATKDLDVPYGTHGVDYLQINLEDGTIRCGACGGDLDATVKETA